MEEMTKTEKVGTIYMLQLKARNFFMIKQSTIIGME